MGGYIVQEFADYSEPLRRKSGELLTFDDRESAQRYALSLPGRYIALPSELREEP